MPLYSYRCSHCELVFEKLHGMAEKLIDCEFCNEKKCLERIPGKINISATTSNAGKIVKEFIDSAKEELKRDRNKLSKQEHK